jgi:hypothetical protein
VNADRFDTVARSLAASPTRRGLLGGILGALLASQRHRSYAASQATPVATPADLETVCTNPDRTGLQERAPGDLVDLEELTSAGNPEFPPGARAWRVLYVSTGRDNTERTLVCGVVIAPESGPTVVVDADGLRRGRVVSWSHGTRGLVPRCQPAADPAAGVFGPTPVGINLVAWSNNEKGSGPQGTAADGILAGMVAAGWIVTASDYYADLWAGSTLEPFIMGKIEAANGIDLVRAAHHLMTEVGTPTDADAYDVVAAGHSQGGHAAMWMGQLLEPYASATVVAGSPSLSLSGVAAEAPASVLIAQPGDPDTSLGAGLFDWTLPAEAAAIGDQEAIGLIFSYVFAAWASYASGDQPNAAEMPAFPPSGDGLDLNAVVTPEATEVVLPIAELCWSDTDLVTPLVAPFTNAPFITPDLANGQTIDGVIHGNFDQTCAGNPSPAMAAWCDWSRYNVPGPRGTSPLPKLPMRGNALAPVLIAAGTNDVVVHCVAPASALDAVPSGSDCVPAALYAALAADYCPTGTARGHLTLNVWRPQAGVTEAGHEDIAGMMATADFEMPRFAGSPLERFITAAFDGTLTPGCMATVVNGDDEATPAT